MARDYQVKQQLLQSFFKGVSRQQIREHNEWFCKHWLPANIHPIGHQRLREHLGKCDRVILLSASPDLYVPALGRELGIEEVICTRVTFDRHICTGRLA